MLRCLTKEAQKFTYLNGEKVKSDKMTLKANDRVIFGTGSVFLFRN